MSAPEPLRTEKSVGVQEEIGREDNQSGRRVIGTWYRQEANEKKRK